MREQLVLLLTVCLAAWFFGAFEGMLSKGTAACVKVVNALAVCAILISFVRGGTAALSSLGETAAAFSAEKDSGTVPAAVVEQTVAALEEAAAEKIFAETGIKPRGVHIEYTAESETGLVTLERVTVDGPESAGALQDVLALFFGKEAAAVLTNGGMPHENG